MATIKFKVDTTGKPYGVKYWPVGDPEAATSLVFGADNKATAEIAPGDYILDWVFWGGADATFQMTATDDIGNMLGLYPPQPDKIPHGKNFEHNAGLLVVTA